MLFIETIGHVNANSTQTHPHTFANVLLYIVVLSNRLYLWQAYRKYRHDFFSTNSKLLRVLFGWLKRNKAQKGREKGERKGNIDGLSEDKTIYRKEGEAHSG